MRIPPCLAALALCVAISLAAAGDVPAADQAPDKAQHIYTGSELRQTKIKLSDLKDTDIVDLGSDRITIAELKANAGKRRTQVPLFKAGLANRSTQMPEQVRFADEARRTLRTNSLRQDIAVRAREARRPSQDGPVSADPAKRDTVGKKAYIASIYPQSVLPGDPLLITGSGFGQSGTVNIFVPGRGTHMLIVKAWSDTAIEVTIPEIAGFPAPESVGIIVNMPGRISDRANITITPLLDYETLPYSPQFCTIAHAGAGNNIGSHEEFFFDVYHDAMDSWPWGNEGTDRCKLQLKNGWIVEGVEFEREERAFGAGGRVTPEQLPQKGDGIIDFSVRWSTEVNGGIWWGIKLHLKGPSGTSSLYL